MWYSNLLAGRSDTIHICTYLAAHMHRHPVTKDEDTIIIYILSSTHTLIPWKVVRRCTSCCGHHTWKKALANNQFAHTFSTGIVLQEECSVATFQLITTAPQRVSASTGIDHIRLWTIWNSTNMQQELALHFTLHTVVTLSNIRVDMPSFSSEWLLPVPFLTAQR